MVEKKSDLGKNTTLLPCNRFHQLIFPESAPLAGEKKSFHQLTSKVQGGIAGESAYFLNENCLGKNWISESWRVCFTCLNSWLTSRNPKLSNGTFKYSFRAREGSQKSPKILGIIFQRFFSTSFRSENLQDSLQTLPLNEEPPLKQIHLNPHSPYLIW